MSIEVRVHGAGAAARRCVAARPLTALDAVAQCGFDVEQPCAGRARCSGCRVRFLSGAPPASPADLDRLGEALCAAGWRLSCQTLIRADAELSVSASADEVAAKSFGPESLREPRTPWSSAGRNSLGYAVDLGTTTLALALVDLNTSRVLASTSARNPQARWGDDVIARIEAARGGGAGAELTAALRGALADLCGEVMAATGIREERVRGAVLCGNSFMTHSVLAIDPSPLGRAPFRGAVAGPQEMAAVEVGLRAPPGARAVVVPPVESHVGGDAVAAMLAVDFDLCRQPTLLIDLGTNTEIAATDGRRVLVASAAAGPAFEGGGIGCGMRAVRGAVDRVSLDEGGELLVRVRGGERASGICGTGLIDAAACLLRGGAMDGAGRLRPASDSTGVAEPLVGRLVDGGVPARHSVVIASQSQSTTGSALVLTAADLRQLQLAKGAIAAACTVLVELLGASPSEVERVHVAGAFGSSLRVDTALRIGLLPDVEPERVDLVGDAAGIGARRMLCDTRALDRSIALADAAEHVELAGQPRYLTTYAEAMGYRPAR